MPSAASAVRWRRHHAETYIPPRRSRRLGELDVAEPARKNQGDDRTAQRVQVGESERECQRPGAEAPCELVAQLALKDRKGAHGGVPLPFGIDRGKPSPDEQGSGDPDD